MISFPNCKINLGLRIVSKRDDGYHNIETIFYPLPIKDAVEITSAGSSDKITDFELIVSGLDIPGNKSTNLCYKAWEILKKKFPAIGPIRMHLLKAIPIGAGLGGGSSDAAHTLLLLNQEFNLGLSAAELRVYALQLGSDCPFFILNKPCIATGRGEIMEEVTIDLNDHYFVLIDTGIHVSTAWAFSKIHTAEEVTSNQRSSLNKIIAQPAEAWKQSLLNDFETPVFTAHPALKIVKDELYSLGATYASLTGTGSAIYGIFNNKIHPNFEQIAGRYKIYNLKQSC